MSLLDRVYDPESFRKSGHFLVDLLADNLAANLSGIPEKVIDYIQPDKNYETGRIKNLATRSNILKNSSATLSGYNILDISVIKSVLRRLSRPLQALKV